MIFIFVVFAFIGWMEWDYMKKQRYKTQAKRIVMGFIICALATSEVLYALRNQYQLATVFQYVFGPLEKLIIGI